MNEDYPAISGKDLIKLLCKDSWKIQRKANHGLSLTKYDPELNINKIAIIPNKKESLPPTLLGRILGVKQTGIGRKGLIELIDKFK